MSTEDKAPRELPAHLRALLRDRSSEAGERAGEVVENLLGQESQGLPTGRLRRAARLSKLAVKAGGRALASKAKGVASRGDDAPERARTDGVELAKEMLETFSQMRGLTMKVGQMLSYIDDVLPPEAQRVLAVLQRDVTPMAWDTVHAQLQRELGDSADALFDDFEREPIAAASIGQVHRARLHDGTRVAVKIQYPGIDQAMRSDLKNARFLSTFKQLMFVNTDIKGVMAELEERFIDECDYRKEADYQEAYAARLKGHPHIVVPQVHRERSSQRVLTTTFYEGRSFYEWLESDPDAEQRRLVTRTFYRFYLGSFYLDGLFNCDPHPGNYLFLDDGRVVFLDYGCSRRFDPQRMRLWGQMLVAVAEDDLTELRRLAVDLDFVKADTRYDFEAFRELMRYLYQPYLEDQEFDFGKHKPMETFQRMFTKNPNLFKLNMPSDAVFLNRIGFGLVSLLSEVGSTMNLRQTVYRYLAGEDPDWPEDPALRSPSSAAEG